MPKTIERLKALFAEVLIARPEDLALDVEYTTLGVDSITAAQLSHLINKTMGVETVPSDLYSQRTINGLAMFIDSLNSEPVQDIQQNTTPEISTEVKIKSPRPEQKNHKPIAIVGLACRLPGAETAEQYWQNLLDGRTCISRSQRWNAVNDKPVQGGFLDDISAFDAGFFRISPNEAKYMDPQQRIMMEVSWHAFEDTGLCIETLREQNCGVFATGLPGDYRFLLDNSADSTFTAHSFLGNAFSSLSGRISYFYDFNGPSITIDSACSSSLSAIQQACLNIQAGSCQSALIGAVSVFSTTELFRLCNSIGMISPTGRCVAFDQDADGFIPSEGCAAIVLMTLEEAERLGLAIYAVIETIAINHDGLSNGLMSPNAGSQAKLINNAYSNAGIDIHDIAYVEAHGTGTKIGDPIEMQALVCAYEAHTTDYHCYIGSSKPVIGHTLVCSGLASLIKVIMCFRHEMIPAHRQYTAPNKHIKFGNFSVNTTTVPWPAGKPLAAISAFGFTGSNAHLVLRKPSRIANANPREPTPERSHLFVFSASDDIALTNKLKQYQIVITEFNNRLDDSLRTGAFGDLSFSLCMGQEALNLRLAIIASSFKELSALIAQTLQEEKHTGLICFNTHSPGTKHRNTLQGIAKRWLADGSTPFATCYQQHNYQRLRLPKYPFNRAQYWIGDLPFAGLVETTPSTSDHAKIAQTTINKVPAAPAVKTAHKVDRALYTNVLRDLRTRLAELLGYNATELDDNKSFKDYGVDSLTAIQLLETVKHLSPDLRPQDLFQNPSLGKLAGFIAACSNPEQSEQHDAVALSSGSPVNHALLEKLGLMDAGRTGALRWSSAKDAGKPLLLLPPLNTGYTAWLQQLKHFRQLGYQVHIPDYPGHMGNHFDAEVFSMDHLSREIQAYITNSLERSTIDVIGWSLGGCLALYSSIRSPQLFSSMVLISTAARFAENIFAKTLELHAELEEHKDYLDIVFAEHDKRSLVERIGGDADMEVLRYYYDTLSNFNIEKELSTIPVRTLVVHGDRDCVLSENDVVTLNHIPKTQLKRFANAGHFIPITAPRAFNKLLANFLQAA